MYGVRPHRSSLVVILLMTVIATIGGLWLARVLGPMITGTSPVSPTTAGYRRIVSLSPAVTEVLFALGADGKLVAVSDYCVIPEEHDRLGRAGTALTPNYEAIAALEPDLILAEASHQAPSDQLAVIAETRMLPWLTVAELITGIEEIGRISGRTEQASLIAAEVRETLEVPAPSSGPRVLLALEHQAGQLTECWFIKDNSIHGYALRAAKARNMVPGAVGGVPRLGLERVIELDPDAILVLSHRGQMGDQERESLLDDWRKLSPLSAVRSDRLAVVAGDSLYFTGPATIRLAAKLEEALRSLGAYDLTAPAGSDTR